MSDTLFDFEDFAETKQYAPVVPKIFPPEMLSCGVHQRHRDDNEHARDCWGGVCPACGEDVLNGFLMNLNHSGAETGICTSIGLRLNHLTYAITHGEIPDYRDMTVIELGWRIGPEGTQIPPTGKPWPHGWGHRWGSAEEFAGWVSRA